MPADEVCVYLLWSERAREIYFLGVWVDEGLSWTGQIDQVRTRVGRLLGVLGRAGAVLGGRSLLSLYNGMVLPHLQYCLMVWGDFQGGRNVTLAGSLLRYQKRFAGLVAGKRGLYHSDPLFAQYGMLKIDDLYRQQLRVHAWRFQNGLLPAGQAAMLDRTGDVHQYATRSARTGIALTARDHRLVGYRVPKEWATLTEGQRGGFPVGLQEGLQGGFPGGVWGICLQCSGVWGVCVGGLTLHCGHRCVVMAGWMPSGPKGP